MLLLLKRLLKLYLVVRDYFVVPSKSSGNELFRRDRIKERGVLDELVKVCMLTVSVSCTDLYAEHVLIC